MNIHIEYLLSNDSISENLSTVVSTTTIDNITWVTESALNLITTQQIIHYDNNGSEADILAVFGPKRDSLLVVIPITFIYVLIFITGVIGNISTCIVISKNKSMHTATNYYLFSLAVSDFLLLVSSVPQEMYSIWSKYPYVFGEVFCILRGLAAETSANATVLTITAFTIERYVAICHPFLSHTMSKLSRAVRLICIIWIISITLAIPQALQFGVVNNVYGVDRCDVKHIIFQHSFELSTFLFFFAPMTLITVLYVLIGLKLRSSNQMHRENGGTLRGRNVNSFRQQTSQGTRRVLKMLVAVVVAFFLCWAPFHAQRLFAIYDSEHNHMDIFVAMTYVSGILYYLSTCINPLLYNIMSNKFREAFKETLARCCQLSKKRYDKKRTYRVLSRQQRRWNHPQESAENSGSSVRDESMYSTSTQKQSFDSVTLPRSHQLKLCEMRSGQLTVDGTHLNNKPVANMHMITNQVNMMPNGNLRKFNNVFKSNVDSIMCINGSGGDINIDYDVPCSSRKNRKSVDHINRITSTICEDNINLNVSYNKCGQIKVTIEPKCYHDSAKYYKTTNRKSKLNLFFNHMFPYRSPPTPCQHIGYYSPPVDHTARLEKYMNSEYSHIDLRELDGTSNGVNRFGEEIHTDEDYVSNSFNQKNIDRTTRNDELSAYMDVIRLRERR